MNVRAIRADTLYKVRAWTRMRGSMVISLILPVILLLAMGFVFNSTTAPRGILQVDDEDGSPQSAQLLQSLASGGVLTVEARPLEEGADPHAALKAGNLAAILTIPSGFGADVEAGRTPNLTLLSNSGQGYSAGVVANALHAALAQLRGEPEANVTATSVEVPPPPYAAFLLPGIIGMNLLSVGLLSSYISVVELRHQGLLQRLAVSPMSKTEWLLARILGQTVISLVLAGFLVLVAWLAFRVPLVVSPWPIALVVLGTLLFAGLGTVLGARVKQPQTGASVINLVILPASLVSGSFFDVSLLPEFLRWISRASPLTYLNEGLRASLVSDNFGLAAQDALVLLALSAVVLVVGGRLVKWTDA